MLWMPCRCNTFDGRLLWFDGVEGKRGLTLTFFSLTFFSLTFFSSSSSFFFFFFFFLCVWGREGWGVKLFDCIVRTGVHGILCA